MYIPFKNKKYITKGIQSALSLEIQTLLWNLIESMIISKKDYFQIFKFTKLKKNFVKIQHIQEYPKYYNSIIITMNLEKNLTIFCIDDFIYSTMLLSKEY